MNVENTSLPEGIQSASELSAYGYDETTLITAPSKPVFKNSLKKAVTKLKNKVKKQKPYECPLCLRRAKIESMATCTVCKEIGMLIYQFCKFCTRKHDIVGSPYTHKANWVFTK